MQEKKPILLMDLDNTLLDFNQQEAAAMEKMLSEHGEELTPERLSLFRAINAQHWEWLEEGRITRQQTLVGRFEVFFSKLDLPLDAQSAEDSYAKHLCEGYYFVPGAPELLEKLNGNYRLFIISNGSADIQAARLKSSGIGKYFEGIFISEQLGATKPAKEFFDLCFARIPGFDARMSLVVGDSLTSDIRGGINAGLKTCWFNPDNKPPREDIRPDYTISTLDGLCTLLDKIFL